jgi:hypothetical protein
MSATDIEIKEGLMPFRSTTLELVYGSVDYVGSVLGPGPIGREELIEYYAEARRTWPRVDFSINGLTSHEVSAWCKKNCKGSLHYYNPMGTKIVWFKDEADLFMFKLKFGI